MSATITWTVEWMQTTPTTATPPETVLTAGWRCSGAETANAVTYNATFLSATSFPAPEGTFTPYEDLTQAQVLGWCWANGVDQTAVEASVQSQINSQINPTVIQPPLPWATPAA
jgi:hypothetical protein